MKQKIRWGIIGLGKIAHSFAKDLQLVEEAELYAVASRSKDKAVDFGEAYGVRETFGSYEELFNCNEVDVVYIATPHMAHCDWSIKAMEAGKAVLCEKPLGVNSREVESMIEASGKNNVFLMEALWSRFNPSIAKVKELVDAGELGSVKYLHADFAFYALDRSEEGRLLNPSLAGGSLLDIGIYPIFLAYLMLGVPDRILSTTKSHSTGVEVQAAMILEYPGSMALLYSGLTSRSEMKAEISASRGSFYLHSRWHESQGYTIDRSGKQEYFELPTIGKGYSHEIMEVHECLRSGKTQSALWSHQNSLELVGILDQVRQQNDLLFPFEA
ncbi:Gfo/Idh/MocA family oxidoreductase [Zeaxanthinibacter sp. PT1]|uniref:Gfo/Idh/MocA family protein n=1 Tax=Zeaxanthinibacter TaxID=561554 RepID=UPI00234B31F3|nr:Gfo/Idh/MocA family oxidoreductase [Zeaxanthinibacter sp. PT1]MDC6351669.1 Gfo/Idh/MocA family oxidoreductase [Zeaxanthinibacter sp. PT1]